MKTSIVSGLLFAILSLFIPVATSAQPSTQPCCVIAAIDARSGPVTARDVSVEGAPNCCRLAQLSQPPGGGVPGARPKLEVQTPRGAPLIKPEKRQTYDLAITAIGSTLQKVTTWHGSTVPGKGPAPYPVAHHVLEAMLKNNGNQTILQAGVECTLRGPSPSGYVYPIMFSSASAGTEYKPGESRPFSVRSPGRIGIGGGIPLGGTYSVACTARIVQPSGVTERNTANNNLTGTISN